jgi:hypothetical protein
MSAPRTAKAGSVVSARTPWRALAPGLGAYAGVPTRLALRAVLAAGITAFDRSDVRQGWRRRSALRPGCVVGSHRWRRGEHYN